MTNQVVTWMSRIITGKKECTLVYRASHNGWNDQKFHEICEKLSDPVLLIGKMENGHIFGGFQMTPLPKTNSFMGKESFLFSLSDGNERAPILIENNQLDELKQFSYSPKDLRFQLAKKLAASQLGNSFKVPNECNIYNTDANNLLLGTPQGVIEEMELFCITNIQTQGPKMQEILRGKLNLKQFLTIILMSYWMSH